MVVYIYIQLCCGQSWGHLWLSTYISSNAMDNLGVIHGCLHIYPIILWTILGSAMVVYIYIQKCPGQSWCHLCLSTYISSNVMDYPGFTYGCLHIYPVMLWAIRGHLWLSTYISSNVMDYPGFTYGCLHIYPVMLWAIRGHLWLSTYISSNAVDNPGIIYGCLIYIQ